MTMTIELGRWKEKEQHCICISIQQTAAAAQHPDSSQAARKATTVSRWRGALEAVAL
jgi:hypothetical protein